MKKKLILILSISLILGFSLVSAAYLSLPTNVTIDIDNLKSIDVIRKSAFIKGNWGSRKADFGINRTDWVPGPMSLASDSNDNLFILDQENKRVKQYSKFGHLIKIIPIDGSTYEDIAFYKGYIYLLDPVISHLVKKVSLEGKVVRVYKIEESIQPITGLYVFEKNVFVEVEHKKFHKIGTTAKVSNVDYQVKTAIEGKPTENFNTEAELNSKGKVEAEVSGHHPINSVKIEGKEGNAEVYSIISIDSDKRDNLYITLDVGSSDESYEQGRNKLLGLVVDKNGAIKSRFYASNQYYTSHFRKISVSPNGTIYQMQTTAEGVVVWKW